MPISTRSQLILGLDQGSEEQKEGAAVASGGRLALRASEEELSATQTCAGQAGDPTGNRASLQEGVARAGLLRTSEHGVYRARKFGDPPWRGRSRSAHLGHRLANSPPAGSSALVAGLLSLRASSCLAARDVGSATGGRRQAESTTASAKDTGDGSRANHA